MPKQTTLNRDYPLPHPDNLLQEDVLNLSQALSLIDRDMAAQMKETQQSAQIIQKQLRRIKINQLLSDQLFTL